MAADEQKLEDPGGSDSGWLRTVGLMALPLAAAWAAAFLVTGLLWWGARDTVAQVAPPAAPEIVSVDADGIDLDRYTTAHPRWEP